MPLLAPGSRIQRVRAVTRHDDGGGTRHRLDRALRSADFEPAGLPAGALLCVRRLGDPLPGRLGSPEREAETNARWSQAVRDSLGRILSTAARPRGGRLPARAEAVLFASEADLLACFALAQAEGRVGLEWWWACALSASDLDRAWPVLWGRNPTVIPTALGLLAADFHLSVVLLSLPVGAASALNRQLAVTHGLRELLTVLADPAPTNPASAPVARPASAPVDDRRAAANIASAPAIAPHDFLPEITPQELTLAAALPVATGLFALLGLLLARNPARVRHPAFAPFVRLLLNDSSAVLRPAARTADSRPAGSPGANPAPSVLAPGLPSRGTARPRPPVASRLPRRKDDPMPAPDGSSQMQVETPRKPALPPAAAPPRATFPLPGAETTILTAHGGIFYLLNLALALGLYGDFTQPLRPGLALSPWEFLRLLGRRLLVDQPQAGDDPLWAALEKLAGTPTDIPAALTSLAEWQPDRAWTDQPLSLPPTARRSIDEFMIWLVPVLSARLSRAGVAFPLLLGQSARVVITSARVEVRFSLSAHPIEIRLAGLDRDPGWIPAAGRDVRFHYE